MRLGRGPQPVYRLHDNVDGRVESEREIGGHQVVVDGFGHTDQRQAEFRVKLGGDTECVVAANGHQSSKAEAAEIIDAALHVRRLLVGIGSRRAEDGASPSNDAVGFQNWQGAGLGFH